jgi:hypothetical protein
MASWQIYISHGVSQKITNPACFQKTLRVR